MRKLLTAALWLLPFVGFAQTAELLYSDHQTISEQGNEPSPQFESFQPCTISTRNDSLFVSCDGQPTYGYKITRYLPAPESGLLSCLLRDAGEFAFHYADFKDGDLLTGRVIGAIWSRNGRLVYYHASTAKKI